MQRINLESTDKVVALSFRDEKESQCDTVFNGEEGNDYGNKDVSIIN